MITRKETALRNPKNYYNWSRELWDDRDCVLAAVRVNYGRALAKADTRFRADREVVLAAVQQDGCTLEYASEDLRADRDVVLAAVRQRGFALKYASDDLRADREVVLTAVSRACGALQFASYDMRADREVVLTAVRESGEGARYTRKDSCADWGMALSTAQLVGWALRFANKELLADRDVMLAAVQQNGCALVCASDDLRADREVVLAALQQNDWALEFADKALLQDEQFMAELSDACPLGHIWCYKPQVTLAETARRAMRSEEGLFLLAKQARVSLLGEPVMMKEFLLSAMEQGCLEDTLSMLAASQKKSILKALRTVMVWYGVELLEAYDELPTDMDSLSVLCNLISMVM